MLLFIVKLIYGRITTLFNTYSVVILKNLVNFKFLGCFLYLKMNYLPKRYKKVLCTLKLGRKSHSIENIFKDPLS